MNSWASVQSPVQSCQQCPHQMLGNHMNNSEKKAVGSAKSSKRFVASMHRQRTARSFNWTWLLLQIPSTLKQKSPRFALQRLSSIPLLK